MGRPRTGLRQEQALHSWHDLAPSPGRPPPQRVAPTAVHPPVKTAIRESHLLRALDQLVEAGVLIKISGRQRYRRYSTTQVLAAALAAFTARAGRRGGSRVLTQR